MSITHRLDDAYIGRAWKRADTSEVEKFASEIMNKAQGIEADELSRLLYLAFRCGFKTAIGIAV